MESRGKNPLAEARKLEPHIPQEYRDEMQGMVQTAGVSYEDLLVGNTIFDSMSLFGCSLFAVSQDTQTKQISRVMATNYHHSRGRSGQPNVDRSFQRYDALQACPWSTSTQTLQTALLFANYYDTVQSILFDPQTHDIHLATAGQYAANTKYTHLKGSDLFGRSFMQRTGQKIVKLARNFDWPLPFLGPMTTVIVRPTSPGKKATAIVGWAGLTGAFSGMNEDGTALSISIVPSDRQEGIPNQFLFRKILEEASDIRTADNIVDALKPASSMNLCLAAADGIEMLELDPKRKAQSAAFRTLQSEQRHPI